MATYHPNHEGLHNSGGESLCSIRDAEIKSIMLNITIPKISKVI
jgi:hypothetical protein